MNPIVVKLLRRELSELKIHCANNHADADRVVAWINNPKRQPPSAAFTEGPERQIAYAIEGLMLSHFVIENGTKPKGPPGS